MSVERRLMPVLLATLWVMVAVAQEVVEGPDDEPEPLLLRGEKGRLEGRTPAERGAALVQYVASCRPSSRDELWPKAAAPAYAARLVLNVDTKYALAKLDAAAAHEITQGKRGHLDPFDKAALVNTYFLAKDRIPKATAVKIRDYTALYAHKVWRGYGAMNYRLMNDGAGFLAAEEWPEMVDADGLNAEQIKQATRARLFGYFEEITRKNYGEYGSPIYAAVNLSATRMLAEFARDPEMRKRATLTLDAMLVDIACSWHQGYNVGSAARAKYWYSTETSPDSMAATAAAAWAWFGAPRSIAASGTGWIHSFWMATSGTYQLPELIAKIAQERSRPSTYRGYVAAMARQDVHRTTYHSLNYSLCSQWDHAPSPNDGLYKEARRNMLKWVSAKPSSTFAVCMDNPQRPYRLSENRANALGYGENPFSQYLQCDGTLLGVYAVPETYPYYKLYVPFTTKGAIVKRIERSGWVFCHNGSMVMAFFSAKPCTWGKKPWNNCDLLWCDARKNAWVLETSELTPFAGGSVDAELNRFAEAVLTKTRFAFDHVGAHVIYQSLAGKTLDLTWLPHNAPYTGQSKIDGRSVDYKSWPIHSSPWVHQEVNRPSLQLKHNNQILTYDFERWTREERLEK